VPTPVWPRIPGGCANWSGAWSKLLAARTSGNVPQNGIIMDPGVNPQNGLANSQKDKAHPL
jgi:hypothetical protein